MENSKRPGENLDGEYSNKRSKGLFMLKQLIPHHVSGVIIGSGGATIIALQKSSDTQIKMSRNNEFYPGTSDRVLVISGSAENVKEAHNIIWKKIYQKSELNSELKMNLVIPHQVVGLIIGKNGTQVKKIKEITSANIHISPKSDNPRLLERVVTIAGSNQSQSNDAFEQIFKILKDEPNSILYPNENYSEILNLSCPIKLATTSLAINPYTHSYGGMNIPNLNFVCNNLINSQSILSSLQMNHKSQKAIDSVKLMLRGAGFSERCMDEIVIALIILSNYGLLPNEEQGQCPINFDAISAIMKNVSISNYSMAESSDYHMSSPTDLPPSPTSGNSNQHQVSEIMHVSESLVGAILGPAGRNLVEIQRSTQTSIIISKKGEFAPSTRDRIVTIMGPSTNAVSKAMQCMQNCVQTLDKMRKYK